MRRSPAIARLFPNGAPRRIAIVRALQLGDLLLAVPAIRAIRRGFPEAEITLIGLPWAAAFASRFARYLDRFVAFPGWPGIAESAYSPEKTERFITGQRAYGYDLVVQMHGSGRSSNGFALALGAPVTVGYYDAGAPESAHGLTASAPYPDDQPEVLRNIGVARLLGCPACDLALEFPLTDADRAEADMLIGTPREKGQLWVGMHAGARTPSRRWPVEHFATLADEITRRCDAHIVLTGGPGEEQTVSAVADCMRTPPLNLAGKTSLGGLAALIARLDLFISNDTGPAHLAEAVGTPSITLFGPADPRRWAPLNAPRHPIIRVPVACSPCSFWECPIDHRCLRRITPNMVLSVAGHLIGEGA
ncbi:MAG: glycosyltransferase family 9 protein, partial [Ktedonobacterales bacterium]